MTATLTAAPIYQHAGLNHRRAHTLASRRGRSLVQMLFPFALLLATGVVLIVLLGIAQRIGWLASSDTQQPSTGADADVVYTCAMHPNIRQLGPGRCPICGMALVPASTVAGSGDDPLAVTIDPAQRRLANIQTAAVEIGPLEAEIRAIGVIAIDESRQATIAAYVDGRLERLFADYTGIAIAAGDHLAVVYSPQLYAAQVEYLEARRALSVPGTLAAVRQAQERLVANTRQRLKEYGMTDEQLNELDATGVAQSRLTIHAPQGGTVIEKLAVEGNYVNAGDPIYRIADLSTVWLMLKLFPEDASRVRFGQQVEAEIQSMPGQKLNGRVAFVDPTVDSKTRTVAIRVELVNEAQQLRPGDYGEARIRLPLGEQGKVFDETLAGKWISPMHPQIIRDEPGLCPICGMELVPTSRFGFADQPVPQPEVLFVPRSAVLMAGNSSIVYVETQPGRFEIRPVTLGPVLRDKSVIVDGLAAGEMVATSGNFLIDSQMQLAGKPSLIDVTRLAAASGRPAPAASDKSLPTELAGQDGELLERLFQAYLEIHASLASDQTPTESASTGLYDAASRLAGSAEWGDVERSLVRIVADRAQHLHHVDLQAARTSFRSISEAVVGLASRVRGSGGAAKFTQFHCPMVPGGGADWIQSSTELLNPYFGSEMLHCGEVVRQIELPSGAQERG